MKLLRLLPLALLLAGCQTVQTDFEVGTFPEIYFQRAQEALDSNDFDTALIIYNKFLTSDIKDEAYIAAAEYEVAFLHYKKGELAEAVTLFKALEAKYADPNHSPNLPAWPKALADKLLKKLEPKLAAPAQ